MTDEEFFDLCRGLSLAAVGCAIMSLFVYVSLQMVIFGFIAPAMVVVSLILFAMSIPYEDESSMNVPSNVENSNVPIDATD